MMVSPKIQNAPLRSSGGIHQEAKCKSCSAFFRQSGTRIDVLQKGLASFLVFSQPITRFGRLQLYEI
jgi:hypothetical protein